MDAKTIDLQVYELNPAALWSHHLNEKIFPHFIKVIPDLEIKEDANKFSFVFRRAEFSLKFEWDENKFFKPTLFVKEKEIKIENYTNKDLRLDAILNGTDGKDFNQIIMFLTEGKIQFSDSLFFR